MIRNLSKKKYISLKTRYAHGFWNRGRGMIGRSFSDFDAMVFENCNCIHTMFMGQAIDVIFVDRENIVCELYEALPPWRPMINHNKAATVIELPRGVIAETDTQRGDALDLNAEPAREACKSQPLAEELLEPVKTMIPSTGDRDS
ncbi:MAG: hypothetical protein A2X49_04575 [Lentisphaerae bacterium GWF2_52_8]|nr:MAG: hypothetical protein A2X49_04575 [Lentisphaerae bacterium GWF2_52_8]